jgi:hypothetical protein
VTILFVLSIELLKFGQRERIHSRPSFDTEIRQIDDFQTHLTAKAYSAVSGSINILHVTCFTGRAMKKRELKAA